MALAARTELVDLGRLAVGHTGARGRTMRLRQSRADRLRGIGDAAAPKGVKACAGGASLVRRLSRGAGAHDPSYLSVDRILISPWYRRTFSTRLAPHRQAVQEFSTTRQGYNSVAIAGRD